MLAKLKGSVFSVPVGENVEVTAFLALPMALVTAEPMDRNCPAIPLPVEVTDVPTKSVDAPVEAASLLNHCVGDLSEAHPDANATTLTSTLAKDILLRKFVVDSTV
ncbi:MAG: hypothetical protein KDB22_04575 [Planctomycetales bacterium]|nr:hypothetical protein [Planctomycetales bacterium]